MAPPLIWLFAFGTAYLAVLMFWARIAARQATPVQNFLRPVRAAAPFMAVMTIGAASFGPFLAMNFADGVAVQGFGFAAIALGGVVVPLTGVLFFKRIWALSLRFGSYNQARFLEDFYESKTLSVLSAMIAVLFALTLGGRVLAEMALLFSDVSGAGFNPLYSLALLSFMLAAYLVAGGIRGLVYLGTLQGVLGVAGILGLIALTLYLSNGYGALAATLAAVEAKGADTAALFTTSGVIQFTRGLGLDAPSGSGWTAMMVFSSVIGFMGVQASPAIHQLVVASRNTRGIAPGQTWVTAAVFGGLTLVLALVAGGFGIASNQPAVIEAMMADLARWSPWMLAALYFCLVSLAFVFAAACHFTAANILVADIYRRNFHKGLDDGLATVLIRVTIAVLVVISALLSASLPAATAALSALCVPLSFQLVPALIGICFARGITRQAAAAGAIIGMVCVILTEDAGHWMLRFVGVELPWGRWPWTMHSALWGMFFNLLAVLVISVITRKREQGALWQARAQFVGAVLQGSPRVGLLWSTAWSVFLAWLFLGVGPGLVMGNAAFVRTTDQGASNILGLPSLIVWVMIAWALGVGMIWFLAYRMELAKPVTQRIEGPEEVYRMPERNPGMNTDRLAALVWIVLAIGAGIALLAWTFGR
ncbi:hypothetical protein [Aestuariivirga sp.]|uniref:hypothetical protein n=1 Tax=Aestuariivirga sp. TaxID=2650926 RepID=UPI0039E62020